MKNIRLLLLFLSVLAIQASVLAGKGGGCTPPTKPTLSNSTASLCPSSSQTYTVTNIVGGASYSWAYSGGATLSTTTGTSTNVTNVTSSGKLSVRADNGTCSSFTGLYVHAFNPPTPNQGSNATICAGGSTTIGVAGAPTSITNVAFRENFSVPDFPGWAQSSSADKRWYHSLEEAPGVTFSGTTAANGYMYINSDRDGSSGTTNNCTLTTPSLNLSSYTSVNFSMSHYYRDYDGSDYARLEFSTDGGTTWLLVNDFATTANPNNYSVSVPGAVGQANVRFRFNYRSNWDYYWFIDDILISGSVPVAYSWSPATGLSSSTNPNPTASPAATTTYTLTATAGTCSRTSGNVTVTVNQPSTAPTSITGTTTICNGSTTTLTASGGTLGTGGTYQWGTGAVGTNIIAGATGVSYTTPSLSANTTYWVRRIDPSPCNTTTSGASTTVTVDQPSTAPTSITGVGTYCHGNSVTLSQSGGSLSGGSTYEWFTGSCGGTAAGTGSSITISPTSTQTYYVRATANGTCPATTCASGVVTLPTAGSPLGDNNESATCVVTENNWIHFYHSSGRLLASVNSGGQNLGNVTVTSYVDGTNALVPACDYPTYPEYMTSVMQRHWVITPQFQPTTPVQVRLPFYDSELSSLSSASFANSNIYDNVSVIGEVVLSKYSGPANVNSSATDNCTVSGGNENTTIHGQTANGLTSSYSSVTGSSFVTYTIPDFSEFWLHGSNNNSPLPIELTSFAAICNEAGDEVDVHWSTASENNASHFKVERSIDGATWEQIGTVEAAGNSSVTQQYSLKDNDARGHSVIYYRLNQVDLDGVAKVYGPTSAECLSDQNGFELFPNPAGTEVTVLLNGDFSAETLLIFTDMSGKEIHKQDFHDQKGKLLTINLRNFEPGVYLVRLIDGDTNSQFVRLVKQ